MCRILSNIPRWLCGSSFNRSFILHHIIQITAKDRKQTFRAPEVALARRHVTWHTEEEVPLPLSTGHVA
jgi:hypothetical protein